jgi:hypothetical protein
VNQQGVDTVEAKINRRTSIDFPQSSYDYITKQIVSGKEKSMRDMLLKLLSYHRNYDISSWRPDDGVLQTHLVRWVMMSDADMEVFEEHLTPEERHHVGLTIGKMWAESWNSRAQTWDGNLKAVDNWSHVAETWKFAGWGRIDYNPRLGRIFVLDCVFSPETVAGTLEGMIGKPVKQVHLDYAERASTRIYAFDLSTKIPVTHELLTPAVSFETR